MYKRFSVADLKNIQSNFVYNFLGILRKEQCVLPGDFFKKIFKEGPDIYYFNRSEPTFRASLNNGNITLIDEKDKIELFLDEEGKKEFASFIKNIIVKKQKNTGGKTIEQILMSEFMLGKFGEILGKKYLVYDIETTMATANMKETKFLLGYAMEPQEGGKMTYEYIDQAGLKKFVKKMIDFDGYIIGFNNIFFDNPVCVRNVGFSDIDLEIINKKTIDLFVFIHHLTGKRLGLNKIATALVGVEKTLESGAEGEGLWKKYTEEGDTKALEDFKKYCKNDVRMTALVLLYLLHYKKLFLEGEEIAFTIENLVSESNSLVPEAAEVVNQEQRNASLFV